MSQPNRKYKRLEALLSESKPAEPNPTAQSDSGDVDALKARVASLQAELEENLQKQDGEKPMEAREAHPAGQSGKAVKNTSMSVRETASRSISAKESQAAAAKQNSMNDQLSNFPDGKSSQAKNAYRVLIAFITIQVLVLGFLFFETSLTPTWQLWAMDGLAVGLMISEIVGMIQTRRGRHELGIWITFTTFLIVLFVIPLMYSGMGAILMVSALTVTILVGGQTLPRRQATTFIRLGILVGIAIILVEFYIPFQRTALPGFQNLLYFALAFILPILGYAIVREFRDYSIRTKFVVAFSLTSILVVVVTTFIYYNNLKNQSLQEFRRVATTSVGIASLQQNGDEFSRISSAQDPLYQKFRVQNLKIRQSDSQFIYVFTVSKDDEGLYFVVDAGEPGEENIAAFGERYDDPSITLASNYDTMTQAIADPDIYTDQYGSFLSAYAPIFTSDGKRVGVIGIDIDAREILQKQKQLYNQTFLIVTTAGLLSILLGFFFGNLLTRPIARLTSDTDKIAAGDFSYRTNILSNDEVGNLGRSFNFMADEIMTFVTGLEDRVSDRTHDLELAAEVVRTVTEKVSNVGDMLSEATELIRSRFDLYYTQVYLLDPTGQTITLRAGTGDVGQQLLRRGHHLLVNSGSLNGRAISEKKPIIVADTAMNPSFLPNPLLPNTRSEMVVPLIVSGRVLGVLDMQSEIPGALNQSNLPAFEALAGQISIAIQNAALFAQSEESRKQMEENVRQITTAGWLDFLNGIDRGEKMGYVFDQTEVKAIERESNAQSITGLSVPITVTGATVGKIQVAQEEREWTSSETQIVQSTADQLAQHIENLRLLAQTEKYRQEAVQTTRRLTRIGWEGYLETRIALAAGYSFNPNEVKAEYQEMVMDPSSTLSLPINVRDEAIGELMINADNSDPGVVNEIFTAVAAQLGDHIENLRLLETTEYELAERTRTEQELLKVRLGMDRANDAVFITETDGSIIYVNAAFERIYGWKADEAIGQTPRILKSGLIPAEQYTHFWGALQNNQVVAGEILNKTKDGRLIPIEGNNNPIVNADGKIIGFLGMHRDITDRKKAEEIIAQRANQLETVATVSSTAATVLDPDKLLQTVVDITKERFNVYHTHIYLTDDSWNTLLLSAGAGEIGRQMVAKGHAIQINAERSLVARATRERKTIIVNDVRSEDGFLPEPMLPETRSEMAVPMIAGDKVIGVFDVQADTVGHFTDEDANIYTTLASQVAVALQNARLYVEQAATVTQLRELDRLKSAFLANMSHELRTPLNSILGFADVILEGLDGPLTDNMSNDLGLIQKNGQHLLHLINDVLDMAKIDSGKMNLKVEKFNVHELLTDVTDITSMLAKEKSLALIIEPDSDREIEINADKVRLRQVMINLVNNAMKFTEKGRISIRVIRENKNVLISVKDTGIGISKDNLEAVFQEFTQLDTTTTRKAGGTGLGLPISRRLIKMHSGRLWAESKGNGKGSTFYVTLPIDANINEFATLTT